MKTFHREFVIGRSDMFIYELNLNKCMRDDLLFFSCIWNLAWSSQWQSVYCRNFFPSWGILWLLVNYLRSVVQCIVAYRYNRTHEAALHTCLHAHISCTDSVLLVSLWLKKKVNLVPRESLCQKVYWRWEESRSFIERITFSLMFSFARSSDVVFFFPIFFISAV